MCGGTELCLGPREQANWTLLCNEALLTHARTHTGRIAKGPGEFITAISLFLFFSFFLNLEEMRFPGSEMHGRGAIMIHYGEVTEPADRWCCHCRSLWSRKGAVPSQNGRAAPTWLLSRGVNVSRLTNGQTQPHNQGCNNVCCTTKPLGLNW